MAIAGQLQLNLPSGRCCPHGRLTAGTERSASRPLQAQDGDPKETVVSGACPTCRHDRHRDAQVMADALIGRYLGHAYPEVAMCESAAARSSGPTAYRIAKAEGRSNRRTVPTLPRSCNSWKAGRAHEFDRNHMVPLAVSLAEAHRPAPAHTNVGPFLHALRNLKWT